MVWKTGEDGTKPLAMKRWNFVSSSQSTLVKRKNSRKKIKKWDGVTATPDLRGHLSLIPVTFHIMSEKAYVRIQNGLFGNLSHLKTNPHETYLFSSDLALCACSRVTVTKQNHFILHNSGKKCACNHNHLLNLQWLFLLRALIPATWDLILFPLK